MFGVVIVGWIVFIKSWKDKNMEMLERMLKRSLPCIVTMCE